MPAKSCSTDCETHRSRAMPCGPIQNTGCSASSARRVCGVLVGGHQPAGRTYPSECEPASLCRKDPYSQFQEHQRRSLFTSRISPETGLKISETALTDSIVPSGLPASTFAPTCGKFDENDIAKFGLCVIGDTDGAYVAGDPDPFVFLAVLKILRVHESFRL